mgnify:CR=1 FL=1
METVTQYIKHINSTILVNSRNYKSQQGNLISWTQTG